MFVRDKRRGGSGPSQGARGSKAKGTAPRRMPRPAELEQRHLDLIALGVIGASLYLATILYLDWSGGVIGSGAGEALSFLLGQVAYAVPFIGALAAAALIFNQQLPAHRPLSTGGGCILAGVLLALAAQTAGLGGGDPRQASFDPAWMSEHGGASGEAMYWVASTLFSRTGAHIAATILVAAGALLLTGGTIATFLTATGRIARRAGQGASDGTAVLRGERGPEEAETAGAAGSAAATVETAISPAAGQAAVPPEDADADFRVSRGDAVFDLETDEGSGEQAAEDPDAALVEEAPPPDEPAGEDDEAEAAAPTGGSPEPQAAAAPEATPMGAPRGVTVSEAVAYRLPAKKWLERGRKESRPDTADGEATARKLVEALGNFGVQAKVVGIVNGPHVSRYELQLAPGIKVKKVSELANDLAYALASTEIRILAPIPGKQAVGVEVPNTRRRIVRLGDIYEGRPESSSPLTAWLGKGIDGGPVWTDLAQMPHVLVAGTTGSGKSGCVNSILSSILMHSDPNEARLVLVDPKQVELNHYESVPHLLTPVVTSPRLAANVLQNLISEMESRYAVMGQARSRNLVELNRTRAAAGEPPLPHILCVIDELADLMMVAPAEVEDAIIRLAQKSRATGIHLVLATQRPSTDIITGTIKVNIPARIAFAVSSQTDSRVILDQGGAESLLGQGDMLFRAAGTSKMERIQGAYVTEEEIARVTGHWSAQGGPEYADELLEAGSDGSDSSEDGDLDADTDELLEGAIRLVVETETASVSLIQRRLRVGYTRAGRLIDMLERRGVISGYEGSKPRQVLVTEADLPSILEQSGAGAEAATDGEAGEGDRSGDEDGPRTGDASRNDAPAEAAPADPADGRGDKLQV